MNPDDLGKMIEHNRVQTENQKNRRRMLGGSAEVVDKVMKTVMIQSDPSYTIMSKLIKLVSGCETFSLLSHMKSDSKHLSIDMEALVGDPLNTITDQEVVLLLNQYGFTDLHGPSGKYLYNLQRGRAEFYRQIVDNEDYQKVVPQLKYAAYDPNESTGAQESYGSGSRPSNGRRCTNGTARREDQRCLQLVGCHMTPPSRKGQRNLPE